MENSFDLSTYILKNVGAKHGTEDDYCQYLAIAVQEKLVKRNSMKKNNVLEARRSILKFQASSNIEVILRDIDPKQAYSLRRKNRLPVQE